jgi:hypothetical protein
MSSSGLTGRSSTPRPLELFSASLEYWIPAFAGMTTSFADTPSRSRDVTRPRFARNSPYPPMRGRREHRVRAAPAVSCAKVHKNTHTSIQVQRRHSGIPCAMGYGLYVLSPAIRPWVVTVIGGSYRQLDASLEASGPHDFAVRVTRHSSKARSTSTASPPHVRDDRERPSEWDGMTNHSSIYDSEKQKYFFERGWTSRNSRSNKGEVICPSGQCVAGTIVDR